MAYPPLEPNTSITTRTIDLSAEVRKIWGPEWNAPSVAYEWSNGKKYYLMTQDAAIYETSPDF